MKKQTGVTMFEVRTITSDGNTALVEWIEDKELRRGYIPTDQIVDGKAPEIALLASLPYGIDWSELEPICFDWHILEVAAHNLGIWTAEDVRRDAKAVHSAYYQAVGNGLAEIFKFAERK